MPLRVSRNEPTGICRASLSGTKVMPFWLAWPPARRRRTARDADQHRAGDLLHVHGDALLRVGRSGSVAGRMVHVQVAGVGSGLPVWSYACTENVWVPFGRPV